jgi:hypothetical protein
MIIYPEKIVNCGISGCNGIKVFYGPTFFQFIKETNNEESIEKYKISFLFFNYFLTAFFLKNMKNILKYFLIFVCYFQNHLIVLRNMQYFIPF